jgi:hypothetical protein
MEAASTKKNGSIGSINTPLIIDNHSNILLAIIHIRIIHIHNSDILLPTRTHTLASAIPLDNDTVTAYSPIPTDASTTAASTTTDDTATVSAGIPTDASTLDSGRMGNETG